jgi:hypothetical protein
MSTKRLLFLPFVYFIFSLLVVILWFIGYAGLMSLNEIKAGGLVP